MFELLKIGEFAPGLPTKGKTHHIKIPLGLNRMVIQSHKAKRAGQHFDIRLVDGNKAHSWAVRNIPKAPGNVLATRTESHTIPYLDFSGTIEKGYGAGTVKKHIDEHVDIIEANNEKVRFASPTLGEMALVKTDKDWLLVKKKPFIGSIDFKPKYKSVNISDLDPKDNTVWQEKIDGAQTIIELGRRNHAYSYRKSVKSGHPIDHTNQVESVRNIKTPKDLYRTVLRSEVFARNKGKAIPAEQVAGILNSNLIASKEKQVGQPLRAAIFDVIKYNGKDVTDRPYSERLEMLKSINKRLPSLELPRMAFTEAKKKSLLNDIKTGKNPNTNEGIIQFHLEEPFIAKAKIREEGDVFIKDINPSLRGYSYSLKPRGEAVGRVGTGFSEELWGDMRSNPRKYIGKATRIHSQGQFPSGAHRAPSHKSVHSERSLI